MLEITRSSRTYVTVRGGPELFDWREQHVVKVPGHQFTRAFKRKQWDGTWRPGDWLRKDGESVTFRFTRGLLPRVVAALGPIIDDPTDWSRLVAALDGDAAAFVLAHKQGGALRDYQKLAIRRIVTSGWGRIAFATNAGKGAVIALLAEYAATRGHSALICCDEIAVFSALYDEITKWCGEPPGVVKAGVDEIPREPVVLAMVPTLAGRLVRGEDPDAWVAWLARQEMLLLDEADRALAPTWQRIIGGATNTLWRAGFSGSFPTAMYEDLQLDELMGPILERVKNVELIDRGISARPTIELYPYDGCAPLSAVPAAVWRPINTTNEPVYAAGAPNHPIAPGEAIPITAPTRRLIAYDAVVVDNVARHEFIASLIQPETPTVVIVSRLDHGRNFAQHCPGAVFLSGDADEQERDRVLNAFATGMLRVLVTTKILDRGTNRLGYAADLILASGEGSTAQILQRIGRGLRRTEGKEWLRVVDILDRVIAPKSRDVRKAATFFERAVRKRLEVYAAEGFDVNIKRR